MRLYAGLVAASLIGAASPALAYHPLLSFHDPAAQGGANDRYFTGSARWKGYDCTLCHVHSAGRIAFSVWSEPPELFDELRYRPDTTYHVLVRLDGEHRIHDTNVNGFVVELLDHTLTPTGAFHGVELQSHPAVDGVYAGVAEHDRTEGTFSHHTPPAGVGPLTFHLAGVDGDGGGTAGDANPALFTDVYGDDTFSGAWRLCEVDAKCEAPAPHDAAEAHKSPAAFDCTATSSGFEGAWWLIVLLVATRKRG